MQHNFHTNLDKNIFRIYAWRMCVQIMGKYQQARFELWTFSHCDTDISPTTLSHKQIATYTQNLQNINLDRNIFRTYAWRMCVQIMGKYQQARFGLWTFFHCDTDISLTTLSHQQIATYTQNLQILKDSIQCSTIFT